MTGRRHASALSPWLVGSVLTSCVVLIPLAVVLSSVFQDTGGAWAHLAETRLGDYISNTLVLVICVCSLTALLGIPTAWLVTMCEFPGRRIFTWALLLPLAVPAYLAAYAMTDLLQFSGPVQTWLRESWNLHRGQYWFPQVRSMPGAIVILSFAFYPYVYFAARSAFLEQSQALLEASRTLGRGPVRTFLTTALPLARPSLIAASILVMMETVAEFGAVEYCAVDTFATGIYRTWLGLESIEAAAQLSSLLLVPLVLVIFLEVKNRKYARYHHMTGGRGLRRTRLPLLAQLGASIVCSLPLVIGFMLPVSRLLSLAISSGDSRARELLLTLSGNTLMLAGIASVIAVVLAVVVTYAGRLRKSAVSQSAIEVCRAGYAIPGPVIAIGVLTALGWIDHRVNDAWLSIFPDRNPLGLILTGSIVTLLFAYQTRFLAVAIALTQGGFDRINRRLDEAAQTLGGGPLRTLFRIHVPMMRVSLFAAGLLVFVDVAKELPATLMLRPFDFDTLAVRVYQLASDERLGEAATCAIAIVIVGLLPVLILHRLIERGAPRSELGS